ncbi:nucleotidyltransferase substrate binding protein [Teredinibacter waterburyi]|uniref:nucleotidyltransferase substrate binding protein n=1 Tax=Teredinibacter waterburyi TaxID=1500538 RepID=UPI00165ED215|nr:nucleotidyltransferase substrate binding protein [Teredinibacter waterburyi]
MNDIRWHQRTANFNLALNELKEAVELSQQRELSKLEEQGLIQAFEYNYELAWNCLKDFYEYQNEEGIQGSRDAIRLAFKRGLIAEGELWMDMIRSRALTSHTYNRETSRKIAEKVLTQYYGAFTELNASLNTIMQKQLND